MTLINQRIALVVALLAKIAASQTPPYRGELLIQPGSNAGKCLTAASNKDGAPVTIQTCTGAPAQKWKFDGSSIKIFGNKCLNVVNGKSVQVLSCKSNSPDQQFFYTPWGDNHISWKDHGKCLDLTGGNTNDGNQPQVIGCSGGSPNQVWDVGYMANALPAKSEDGQSGTNSCGTGSSQSSMCQTAWINSAEDFCLWAPPSVGSIGDTERYEVAWCTKSGRGTRTIPNGTLKGVHFVRTQDYVQVTGVGDFTKMNVPASDDGGELDPHGPDNNGNPVGGLVYGNSFGPSLQYHEWTSFMSDKEFCFRACTGPNARQNCQHIYDLMGCQWNMPANYEAGKFEDCKGNNDEPMGVYGTSTWYQGVSPTPPPHKAAPSSQCKSLPTVGVTPAKRKRESNGFEYERREPMPQITAPPV